jgi:hypothetical protein
VKNIVPAYSAAIAMAFLPDPLPQMMGESVGNPPRRTTSVPAEMQHLLTRMPSLNRDFRGQTTRAMSVLDILEHAIEIVNDSGSNYPPRFSRHFDTSIRQ